MNTLSPAGFKAVLGQVAIRLADEGVPVRAIARATKVESEQVRDHLMDAVAAGMLLDLPRDDWTIGVPRNKRQPAGARPIVLDDSDLTVLNVVRTFKLTQQQAALFITLLKRREVTRAMLHSVIEARRPEPKVPTDQKIVDVVICKLRKKIEPFGLTIKTVWSCGYLMSADHQKKALQILNDGGV